MTDSTQENADTEVKSKYDELPDAPPKKELKLTWVGKLGVAVVVFWLVIAFIGPYIAPFHEADIMADDSFMPIFTETEGVGFHVLGTDYLERDIFSRIIWGARTTIGIAVVATLLAYLFGVTLGIAAAVKGGWADMGMSRVNDAILSLPTIMLGLLIVVALGASIPVLIGTAAVIYASSVFRIARALGQDIMVMDFVEAAIARGEGLWWVITREVLPNAAMPLATDFGLRLVFVVLFISSMSFLGVGIQPPAADWGSMVRQNLEGLGYGSYAAVWPALSIATFTISINLIVDDISAIEGGSLAKKMI
ncbi:MAG: ABC transporter permease [Gammaproteobacteria bacterium]|jgi:peptide/nickel transport system permease protein|nr:ABC transporter permease [Gammaproteobacteria bacterium]